MDGIVILAGPGIPAGTHIEGANIIDIAPTVLALMGLPVPGEMDGKALLGVEARQAGGPKVPGQAQGGGGENPYSEEDEAQVMERLRELGYVA